MSYNLENIVREILDGTSQDVRQAFFDSEPANGDFRWDTYTQGGVQFIGRLNQEDIEIEHIERFGGYDEDSREYWSLYSFTRHGESVYVKFEGTYYPYIGSELDEYKFVRPIQKMVTVYE